MKKMKKLFAILMTMAMVMGLGITGFAAQNSATITVNGLNEGATITYLQVVEPDTSSPIGWKFSGDTDRTIANAFKTAFNVDTDEEALNALIDIAKNDQVNGDASEGELTSSEELSKALTALKDSATDTDGVKNNVITVSKAGLYIVVAHTNDNTYIYVPMLAYVADSGEGMLENAIVSAKGSHNEITKEMTDENAESVYAGDEIPYKATVEYPYYSKDSVNPEFTVTDILTNATFKADSVKVKVKDGADLTLDKDYTVNQYANTNNLIITFNYDLSKAGSTVEITYVAIVGEGTNGVSNKINTNFDKDGDTVTVDQVEVEITKVNQADETLSGAVFSLYNVLNENAYKGLTDDEKKEYTCVEDATVINGDNTSTATIYVKWLKDSTKTGENGKAVFSGLDAQVTTYYIKEKTAPSGYTLNEAYYLLKGAEKDSNQSTEKIYVYTDFDSISVEDTKVSALPETGGMGTTLFTIAGCVIMISAAGLFFATRKKAN